MTSYEQYCPTARAAEIFATPWTPLIVRNLLLGCRTYGEVRQGLGKVAADTLNKRLKMLEREGVVHCRPNPNGRGSLYELTEAGIELGEVCRALAIWGSRWTDLAPSHCGAEMVLWGLCRHATRSGRLPSTRAVVRFDVRDSKHGQYWVLLDRPRAELCVEPPGFRDDLEVVTSEQPLARWFLGQLGLSEAEDGDLIRVTGPQALKELFDKWGGLGTPRGRKSA